MADVGLTGIAMSENLKSALSALQDYVNARGLAKQVSLELEEHHIRISLLAEGRDLWMGLRYFLIADRTNEPQMFFDLNEATLSRFLPLPSGVGVEAEAGSGGHFLFVSYSRADETLIAPLVDLLRLTDTEVFRDRDSIRAGDKWRAAIEKAIQQSTECLVFWCEHSSGSPEVAHEITLALQLRKRLVPVLLDESPLNGELKDFQAIDMRPFKPYSQAEPSAESSTGSRESGLEPVVPKAFSSFREEAATYLEKRLQELLGIKPLLSIEQPNKGMQPTAQGTRRG